MDLPEFSNTNIEPEIQNPYSSGIQDKSTFELIGNFWKNFTGKQKVIFSAIMVMVFAVPITAGIVVRQRSLSNSRAFNPIIIPVTPPVNSPSPAPTITPKPKPTPTPIACVRQYPTFTVTPVTQKGTAGQTLTYTVKIQTNDNLLTCSNWNFTLVPSVPTGWKGSTTMPSTFSVGPRNSVSFEYKVTSPTAKLIPGKYIILFTLTGDNLNYKSTQKVIYEALVPTKPFATPRGGTIPIPTTTPLTF